MRRLPRPVVIAGAVVVVALALIAWIVFGHQQATADEDIAGSAVVSLAPIKSGQIADTISATGIAQADPGGMVTISAPRAAVVRRMLVRPGQPVTAGEALVEIADAPGVVLAFAQAVHARDFASKDLERTRRLESERLATNDQLTLAQKTLADAESALKAEQAQGAGHSSQILTAPSDGVVLTAPVSPGDRVAEAADLVTISGARAAVVRLWIVPGEGARLAVGDGVTVAPIFGGAGFSTRLSHVGRLVDATTHMLDAEAPAAGSGLPVGASVKGSIITGAHTGLSVPRAAVVFDDTGAHIFTVAGGKASRVQVEIGRDQGGAYEVKGPLRAGTLVAVSGAYQLEDGMKVRKAPS